jgi:hypothetical protein
MNIRFGSGREERGIFYAAGIMGVVPSGNPNKLYMRSFCTSKSVSVKEVV